MRYWWARERYQILAEIDALAVAGDATSRGHTRHRSVLCRSDDLASVKVLAMKLLREPVDRVLPTLGLQVKPFP
jgi:predicted GNAT superfamily acetyltransferase